MKSSTKIRVIQSVLRHAVVLLLVWLGTWSPYLFGALRDLDPSNMWGALGFAMGMGVLGVVLADSILTYILGQSVGETLAGNSSSSTSRSSSRSGRGKRNNRSGNAPPAPPPENVEEYTGVVIRYNQEKGYGFLQADELREEPFFHRNDVDGITLEQLRPGLGVSFAAFHGPKGMRAQRVCPLPE